MGNTAFLGWALLTAHVETVIALGALPRFASYSGLYTHAR